MTQGRLHPSPGMRAGDILKETTAGYDDLPGAYTLRRWSEGLEPMRRGGEEERNRRTLREPGPRDSGGRFTAAVLPSR